MSVHVGDLTTEVIPELESGATGQADGWTWSDEERMRAVADRLARDAERTRAEGFDD